MDGTNVLLKTIKVEENSALINDVTSWKKWEQTIEKYSPDDVYSADKIGSISWYQTKKSLLKEWVEKKSKQRLRVVFK